MGAFSLIVVINLLNRRGVIMSSPMSVLKPYRRIQNQHQPPTARKSMEDSLKLPELTERSKKLYGRNYHSGAEAYNFASPRGIASDTEMPNLLCDYTNVDLANREPTPDSLDRFIADFVHSDSPTSRIRNTNQTLANMNKTSPRTKTGNNGGMSYVPSAPDIALMTSMASRLRHVESQLKQYSREIIEKDVKIKQLEERLKTSELELSKVNEVYSNTSIGTVQKRCEQLQKQDYGMIWVGDSNNDENQDLELGSENENSALPSENGEWSPDKSIDFMTQMPFDQILKGVRDLNVLVGEGIARIAQTKTGATFKIPEPVNLEFYADGFILFDGPFRKYSDEHSREFIGDILDGYFPSELRDKYPEGTPFAVKDRRDAWYLESGKRKELFPGSGHTLLQDLDSRVARSGNANGRRKSLNSKEFTRKLPLSVVKNGKVIDIRNDIEAQLNPDKSDSKAIPDQIGASINSGVTVLATKFMKQVYEVDPSGQDTSGVDPEILKKVSTIRIRSSSGQNCYIAKIFFNETIGDIRNYLHAVLHSAKVYDMEIITTYPKKVVHRDDSQTIADAGLVPTAVLILKEPKD